MKILIIGCGKFGVRLAADLGRKNHRITIVDKDPEAFTLLGEDFTGNTVCGIGYDREILERAGIAAMDAVICCASSDSANAVSASIAKNVYHVPTVIARMYDPTRAKMFESMGIYTISITRLGTDHVMDHLEDDKGWRVIHKMNAGDVQIVKVRVPMAFAGMELSEIERAGMFRIAAVERGRRSLLPEAGMRCSSNDVLYLAVRDDCEAQVKDLLGL